MSISLTYFFLAVSPHETTACSPANRSVDLEPCLTGIRQGATNMSLFWFGTEYSARCPPNLRFTVDCFSRLTEPRSLVSLVFGNNTDLSSLDRYVEVSFTSAPGLVYFSILPIPIYYIKGIFFKSRIGVCSTWQCMPYGVSIKSIALIFHWSTCFHF